MKDKQENSQKSDIQIAVSNPLMELVDSLNFITYEVKGRDYKGQFNIRRRYRDFNLLRYKLVEKWIGIYIPPIDSKKLTGNMDEKFIQSRCKFLNYFCLRISEKSFLYNCPIFQAFIRGGAQFEKLIQDSSNIDLKFSVEIYQRQFSQIAQKKSSAEVHMNNETDYEFLKKSEKKLQQIRSQFREIVQTDKLFKTHLNLFVGKILPEYEQRYLIQHVQSDKSKLIIEKDTNFKDKLISMKDSIDGSVLSGYIEMISVQLRQTRALMQAIESRKQAQKKKTKLEQKRRNAKQQLENLKAGKMTLKSVFLPGSKDVQIKELQLLIPQCETNEDYLSRMIGLMNACNNQEIKKFKQKRGSTYMKTVLDVTKKQMLNAAQFGRLFQIPINNQA